MYNDAEQLQHMLPKLHIIVCENLSTKMLLNMSYKFFFHDLQTRTVTTVSDQMLPSTYRHVL